MGSSNNSSAGSSPLRMKCKLDKKKLSVIKKTLMRDPVKSDAKGEMAIRVGERRKRAKKVFDPSENNLPSKRKRGRPVGSLNKTTIKKQSQSGCLKLIQRSKSDSVDSSNEEELEISVPIQPEVSNKGTGGVCSVCRQYRSSNDSSDKLVGCRDCSNKAHPSCLQGDGMLRLRPDNTWQCPHCKTCVVCIETTDAGILTVCNICADAYHSLCHMPPISEKKKAWNQWECRNCTETKNSYGEKMPSSDRSSNISDRSDKSLSIKSLDSDDKNNRKYEKDSSLSPIFKENAIWNSRKLTSPVRDNIYDWKQEDDEINIEPENSKKRISIEKSKKKSVFMSNHDHNILYQKRSNYSNTADDFDSSIPDADTWTYEDVYQYFLSYFPEQAHVFKDQQIDGKSLLMMRRIDVISNLNLQLGPALKIYRHVVKLQSRKDDITMCWL